VDSAPVPLQSVHHPAFLSGHSNPHRRQRPAPSLNRMASAMPRLVAVFAGVLRQSDRSASGFLTLLALRGHGAESALEFSPTAFTGF
jgi:hypothetical protein